MAPDRVPAIISNNGRLDSPLSASNFGKSSASALKAPTSYTPNAPPPVKSHISVYQYLLRQPSYLKYLLQVINDYYWMKMAK